MTKQGPSEPPQINPVRIFGQSPFSTPYPFIQFHLQDQ